MEFQSNNLKIGLAVVLGLICSQLFAFNPPQSGEKTLRLTRKTFRDKGAGNIKSHSVLVPAGWKADGGAFYPHSNFFRILPSQRITVTSPEGAQVTIGPSLGMVDFLPSSGARQMGAKRPQEGASSNGYLVFHCPESLDEWKKVYAEKLLPKALKNASNIRVRKVSHVKSLDPAVERQLKPIQIVFDPI